jgi:sugar lactone lactonase YvrE
MQFRGFFRGASFAALLAAFSLAGVSAARAASQPVVLPTGATITPDAAPGSVFQPLAVALPDYPNFVATGAVTTAVSPDGKTLLILTSGFNKQKDANGNVQPQDSSEFVFVYDISAPSVPVQTQVVFVPNTFSGLVWSPDGTKFYVAGGKDDNLHTYTQANGVWGEATGSPIALNHKGNLMNKETGTGPTAAGVGVTADGSTVIVANWETDSVTAVDVVHNAILAEYDLRPGIINPAQSGVAGGEFPFGVLVKGNNTVYVSSARDREIDVLNLAAGVLTMTNRIPVKGNPENLTLNKAQSKLFVAVANADAMVIIDTAANGIVGEVNASAPVGVLGNGKIVPRAAIRTA